VIRPGVVLFVCALAGCGRIGFSELSPGDDVQGDDDASGGSGDSGPLPLVDCRVANPMAFLCESFENPARADPWYYEVGSAASTTTRAYRGARALEVTTSDSERTVLWGAYLPSIAPGGHLYVRGWYWVSSAVVWTDATLFNTENNVDPYPATSVTLRPGMLTIASPGDFFDFVADVPRDRWFCLQVHIAIGNVGAVELTIDGRAPLVTGATDTRAGNSSYSNLEAGVTASAGQGPVVMWIDEVVADRSPVACD